MKLNKNQLDLLGTFFGLVAGICGVLNTQHVGNPQIVGTVGGIATVFLGVVVQRPASDDPTTAQAEAQAKKDS